MKTNRSTLLINEPALQVLPSLAVAIGLEEAIVLQQVHYWLDNIKNEGRTDENGIKWVYNTYAEWKNDNFPFWSEDKIQRIFLSLEKYGLIISAQLDAKKRDMRKFYRIDYDALCVMDDSFLRPSNTANMSHVNKNTETTTETTSEKPEKPKSKLPHGSDIGFMLAAGVPSEEIAAVNEKEQAELELLFHYEKQMSYGTTLDWWGANADLVALRKFLVTQSKSDIETFCTWCNRKYSKFRPEDAARFPRNVMIFWPMAFKQSDESNEKSERRPGANHL